MVAELIYIFIIIKFYLREIPLSMKSNDKLAKFGAMYRMLREAIHLVKRFAQDILNFTIHYIHIFLFRDNETAKFRRPLIVLRARVQRRLKALTQNIKKLRSMKERKSDKESKYAICVSMRVKHRTSICLF